MTNHTIPAPGDFRVCVIAAPGHAVAVPVRDAKEAEDARSFSTATNAIARAHGFGGTFPTDAFIQRFNGRSWEMVSTVTDSTPWRVVTVQGVFRFRDEEQARKFAAPGEIVEYAPDPQLSRA